MNIEGFLTFINRKIKIRLKKLKKSKNSALEKFHSIDFSLVPFQEYLERVKSCIDFFTFPLHKSSLLPDTTKFMQIYKIRATSSHLKQLSTILKNHPDSEFPLDSDQTLQLFINWYQTCHNTENLRSKLLKTINEYEILKNNTLSTDEKTSIDQLITSFKQQLSKIPNKLSQNSKFPENFHEKCQKGLFEIFSHYSKQQFLLGKNPTFDYIQKNLKVLTLAKFLKFCKDFEIIKEKDSQKNIDWVRKVFKSHSDFNKEMYEHHFLASINSLAQDYFNEDYDRQHSTKYSNTLPTEKLEKFYQVLGLSDPSTYSKKLKSFAAYFGVESYSRIPANDLSKKYKYDPKKYKKLKMSVDEWKMRKKQEQPADSKNSLAKLKRNNSEYTIATVNKIKKDIHEVRPKPSISAIVKLPDNAKSLTFRGIQDMNLAELNKLDEEYNINHLISSYEDEDLTPYLSKSKKILPVAKLSPNFPQIIKTSDNQLNKIQGYSKKVTNL